MSAQWADLASDIATTYNLDSGLLLAQIDVESGGDPFAFRYEDRYFEKYIRMNPIAKGMVYGPLAACSYGLLQVLLETAMELGFTGPPHALFDPRIGLTWGARYLERCIHRANGDYRLGLVHYNGAGSAAKFYADRVLERAGRHHA